MANQQNNTEIEVLEEYKLMIDKMLKEEANGEAQYVSAEHIRNKFLNQGSNLI